MPGLGPARRVGIGVALSVAAALGFTAGRVVLRPSVGITQPIAFNHRLHTEMLECETCHEFTRRVEHPGLPGLSICLQCHEEPQTDSAEERKLVRLADENGEQVFRKLFRLPDNVYYPHRLHVGIAGLGCESCHGDIAGTESPPIVPLIRITMDFCVDCHRARDVSTDCTRCHR
jgi:menaquinone reductase, multiheme cytochrome c subunit